MPRVTVIIPVRNGESTIGDCLASVLKGDYPRDRLEVVVVDNGSTDRTFHIAQRFDVRCLREPQRGAVHARNRGIAETSSEIVAFTDADCMVTKDWLREITLPFADLDVAATAGELVAFPPSTAAERYMARRKPRWQEWASNGRMPWFLIGNSAVRRDIFGRIGLLDPSFAVVGCEDIDFAFRFFDAGLQLRRCPRAVAFHRHRASAGTLFRQQRRDGRGQSLIQHKYRSLLPWGVRHELDAWRDLAADACRFVLAPTRAGRRSDGDRDYAYYDLIRKLAQRIGFAEGAVRWRVADVWRGRRGVHAS